MLIAELEFYVLSFLKRVVASYVNIYSTSVR